MKKLLLLLLSCLLLSQQQLHSLALQPLSGQSEIKKRYAIAESAIYYRRDLKILISDWGVDRELLIKFGLSKQRLDEATLKAKDGRLFKLKTQITGDGVFETRLIDIENDNAVSDVVFGCDTEMAIDLELEEVQWEDADFENMAKLGLGEQILKLFFQDWFEFKGEQYVINVPSAHQIVDRKPVNIIELYDEFEKTPIGKLTKRCGVTKYVIKYIARDNIRVYKSEEAVVVTQENLSDFIKWTTTNGTFILDIDYRKVLSYEEARFLAHRHLTKVHPELLLLEPQDAEDNVAVVTVMLGINKRIIGEYEISCILLKNGWVNIFLIKDGVRSSMIAEILPNKLNMWLNDVSFGPTRMDLTRHKLGGQLVEMISGYVPVGFVVDVAVLNEPTIDRLAVSKIQTLEDIDINFALTPIGKLFVRNGFGKFKYSFPVVVEYDGGIKKTVPLEITAKNAKAFPMFAQTIKQLYLRAVKLGVVEQRIEDIDLLPLIQREMEGQIVGKFKLVTEIAQDGGLYIYLTLNGVKDEQAALVVLPDLSTDIELQSSSFGDLRGQGIGKKLFTLYGKALPVGTECRDLVVNEPTVKMIHEANITCMKDLNRVFSLTPVGKLHWAAGYNEYDFYFYDHTVGREVLVTEDNVVRLYKNIKTRNNFELVSKKTMTMKELESFYAYTAGLAGCKYIGIQHGVEDIEDTIMFNAPSHTTLSIPRSEFCYEAVLKKLGLPLALKKTVDVEVTGVTGEIILRREDYLKIIRREATHGFENTHAVLKAG